MPGDLAPNPDPPRILLVDGIELDRVPTVFRPDIQGEIVTRLGWPRTQMFLATLLTHCEDTLHATRTGHADLDQLAHDLASTSGMLGYEDLSNRCRDILIAPDETERGCALPPLQASLTRAIRLLRSQTGRAEAAA